MTIENQNENEYWDGLPEFVEELEDAEAEHPSKPKAKNYRKRIQQEAEWRLRKEGPKSTAPKPANSTQPKTPGNPAKPKADHGSPPGKAPMGQSWYWADSSKGGGQ